MTPASLTSRAAITTLAVALAGAWMFWSAPALAHNVVEDRIPEPGSVVQESPLTVSIGSNDVFLDISGDGRGFALVAVDDAGLFYGDGCVTITERRMEAVIALGDAGTYDIVYQFVSADGHSLSDRYSIVFEPTAAHTPARGQATAPVCGEDPNYADASVEAPSAEEPQAQATPEPVAASQDEGFALSLPTIAGLVVLVIVATGLITSGLRAKKNRA